MADEIPHKGDIIAIFKRLRAQPLNKVCFDCSASNPTWSSVTYGVFLCIDCSAVHRGLGVHLSFVRSTQLDTNWTWLQLRHMQLGGNANARKFFHQHNCTSTDAQQKYHSRAAQLYKDKLHGMAVQAMKLYGTQVHIDTGHQEGHGDKSHAHEVDFFDEHSSVPVPAAAADNEYSAEAHFIHDEPAAAGSSTANGAAPVPAAGAGPNVELALSTSPTQHAAAAQTRKSTIGQRRPAASKMGARKLGGGLGAQKVKKDFSEIERQAEQADQARTQAILAKEQEVAVTAEEKERQLASVRLAYQDLSLQQKKQSDKLKNMDPKKAEQMERLGMGFGGAGGGGGVSHSAFSDMETIEQSAPAEEPFRRGGAELFATSRKSREAELDDFFSTPSSKSKNAAGGYDTDEEEFFMSFGSGTGSGSGGLTSARAGITSSTSNREKKKLPPPAAVDTSKTSCGDEAQKKFGNAKAISSSAYFGDDKPSFESQQNINRFQGARGISSADYFGESQPSPRGGASGVMLQAPDLEDVKESVRQGVTKVAGKLGTLANGVMSSLQERGYY